MAMVEYLERPEETKEIFLEDGFMRTGDLGLYNEQGGFSFVDRLKEMIKYVCVWSKNSASVFNQIN